MENQKVRRSIRFGQLRKTSDVCVVSIFLATRDVQKMPCGKLAVTSIEVLLDCSLSNWFAGSFLFPAISPCTGACFFCRLSFTEVSLAGHSQNRSGGLGVRAPTNSMVQCQNSGDETRKPSTSMGPLSQKLTSQVDWPKKV